MKDQNKTKERLAAELEAAGTGMHQSPVHLTTIIALSVFISEVLVMLLLSFLPSFSTLFEALLDSTLLAILLSSLLYYFSIFISKEREGEIKYSGNLKT